MSPMMESQDVHVKARALENHAFVVLANRVGSEEHLTFFGWSCVCDPLGRVLCLGGSEPELLFADLDPSVGRPGMAFLRSFALPVLM
jgi:5-aminopentanamidase